jgi:hypothetical protein
VSRWWVKPNAVGGWDVQLDGAPKHADRTSSRSEAERVAQQLAAQHGGEEIVVVDLRGKILAQIPVEVTTEPPNMPPAKPPIDGPGARGAGAVSEPGPANEGTIEIVPPVQRQVRLIFYCLVLLVMSLSLLFIDGIVVRLLGLLGTVFVVYASVAWWKRFRYRQHIVLAPDGLRLPIGGWIPWNDIEIIDLFNLPNIKVVGICLSSYAAYLASLTPTDVQVMQSRLKALRGLAGGAALASAAQFNPRDLFSYAGLVGDAPNILKMGEIALAKNLASVAGMFKWNREHYGFEWGFSFLEIDRPLEQFADLLKQYHQAAIS